MTWQKTAPKKRHHTEEEQDELEYLRGLVKWAAPWLRVRAASMKWMTANCKLCTNTKLRKENCRHNEFFKYLDHPDEVPMVERVEELRGMEE